jgi:hypothetical protein
MSEEISDSANQISIGIVGCREVASLHEFHLIRFFSDCLATGLGQLQEACQLRTLKNRIVHLDTSGIAFAEAAQVPNSARKIQFLIGIVKKAKREWQLFNRVRP